MPKKTTKKRPIDQTVSKNMDWWGKSFVFIKEKEVKSWQAIFAIAFVSGILATLIWSIPSGFSPKASAQSVGIFFTPRTECRVMPPGGEVTASTTVMIRCGDLVTKANYILSDGRTGTIVNRAWSSKDEYSYKDFVYASNENLTMTISGKWHFWIFEINFKSQIYSFTAPTPCVDSDGLNYYTKGYVTDRNNTTIPREDICAGVDMLVEQICENDLVGIRHYNCPNGCIDGACAATSTSGSLLFTISSSTPPTRNVVMGQTNQILGEFQLSANDVEDIDISRMVFGDLVGADIMSYQSVRNLKLMSGGAQISEIALPDISSASTSQITFNDIELIVPKNSIKIITLVGDIVSYGMGAVSGSIHYLGMLPVPAYEPITAIGLTSGELITGDNLDIGNNSDAYVLANPITLYRTNVAASWAQDTPNGTSVGGSGYTIAKINVSNYLNIENANALIKKLNINLRSDIESLVGSSTRTLLIYKDSISSGNIIGRYIFDSSSAFGDTDIDIADTYIASGNTKTFILTLDTQDARMNNYLSVWMDKGDLEWSDGITSSINETDGLPLSSKTLRY